MNKKAYTPPTSRVCRIEIHKMICVSINNVVGGDTGITNGGDETDALVGSADSRRGSIWDDEY